MLCWFFRGRLINATASSGDGVVWMKVCCLNEKDCRYRVVDFDFQNIICFLLLLLGTSRYGYFYLEQIDT